MAERFRFPDKLTDSLRIPPYSIHAEQSLLGGLMLDNQTWDIVADRVVEEDFYRRDHRLIFRAIQDLGEKQSPFDVVTLAEMLDKLGSLEEAGGLAYLGTLARETPSAANILAYADIVREKSVLRQLIHSGTEIADSAFNPEGRDLSELLEQAEQKVFRIADQRRRGGAGFKPVKTYLARAVERIDMLFHSEGQITGASTGFTDLDEKTSGMQSSDLIIIAGRPSMGKCCAANTEILLWDGRVTTLESIYRQREATLLTLGSDWKFHPTHPSHFVDDGHKPVFRVTTGLGRYVDTTLSHPYLTLEGWKPLAELRMSDSVAIPRTLPIFGTETLPEGKVQDLAEHLENDASNREIPATVFQLNRPQLAQFLNRLFALHGWATVDQDGQPQLGLDTICEKLARQLQHLLLRFGVTASLGPHILRNPPIRSDHDALAAKTSPSLMAVEQRLSFREGNQSSRGSSGEPRRYQLTITDHRSIDLLIREIGIEGQEEWLARTPLDGEKKHDPPHRGEVIWDEVVSIEYLGIQQVYDLTIPETHNFVANDICVHNTTFAMNIAEHIAIKEQTPVAVFSMEMPGEQLAMRMISSLGRIDQHRIRSGKLEEDEWPRLTSALNLLAETKMFIDDTPAMTPLDVRARCRRLAREHGPLGLIMLDYLQLMRSPGSENRVNEISDISRSLKALAKEMSVPVIALSQLNRSLEQRPSKRPVMSDLRECVSGDTLVMLSDGRRIPIRELVGTQPEVLAMSEEQKIVKARSDLVWSVGVKPLLKMSLASGRVLRATPGHRLLTGRGWRLLGEIAIEERIAVGRCIPDPSELLGFPDHERGWFGHADLLHAPTLTQFAGSDLIWDRVVGIEPDGEEEVYDLTVPGPASWLADGIVSHNSGAIEQDADLIMFIYRDEVYNPETQDKGKAEIIIAKQRNGPIGTVFLTFLGHYTRFENYISNPYTDESY
jgi:replicative DNA helicase